jgi:3-methyl-2-oxobutanoate hydroxymethyltransferase
MTKLTIFDIRNRKNSDKIISLTAYTYPIAKILDEICDVILVGDSLGMTIYGFKDTVDVTLDMMINHGKAVTKAVKKSLVVIDLPYGTYEDSKELALKSAQKIIAQTNADAIKIELTKELIPTLKYLVGNGVNVMGHIGLLPQHVRKIGGYKYQGTNENSAREILEIAKLSEENGAFSIVIEAVPADLATKITNEINIPTIGIGASENCDGQILVIDDLLGLNQEFKPKFVKHYENFAQKIEIAAKQYSLDVKSRQFPAKNNII